MFSYYILNMFRTELLIFLKIGSSYLGAFSLLEHWAVSRAFCLAGLEKGRWMLLASWRQGLEVLPDVLRGVEQAPTRKFILVWNGRTPRLKRAFHDHDVQFLNYSFFCLFSPHIFVVGLLVGFETDLFLWTWGSFELTTLLASASWVGMYHSATVIMNACYCYCYLVHNN